MRLQSSFVLGLFFVGAALAAPGPKFRLPIEGPKSKVEFLAVGNPSALKIRGELKGDPKETLKGELRIEEFKATGSITAKLAALETGIGMRDRHMKEKYLETDKYPDAKLDITDLIVPHSFVEDGFNVQAETFKGTLTMREKTVPVAGTVSMKGTKEKLDMRFEFKLKTPDYKISAPAFMGVTMAEEVTVTADVTIVPEKLP